MAVLVGPESLLVFDLLELSGTQDWLLTSATIWHFSKDYTKLQVQHWYRWYSGTCTGRDTVTGTDGDV